MERVEIIYIFTGMAYSRKLSAILVLVFDLDNVGQGQGVQERDLRHSTRNVRIHISDFFSEFLATWQQTFRQNVTYPQRETDALTRGKSQIRLKTSDTKER